jgi:hypothetical protein
VFFSPFFPSISISFSLSDSSPSTSVAEVLFLPLLADFLAAFQSIELQERLKVTAGEMRVPFFKRVYTKNIGKYKNGLENMK